MANKKDDGLEPNPDFPMHFVRNRLSTYTDWPFGENCSCTPEKMAAVGFYHCPTENEPDLVKCFMCLKELDGWEPDDDPWTEHKSHSGKCPFLQFCNSDGPKKMTVENLIKLEKERQVIFLRRELEQLEKVMTQFASDARKQMESLAM